MKPLRMLANTSICFAILVLVASSPVAAADAEAPATEPAAASSESTQVDNSTELTGSSEVDFLFETGAVDLAKVGEAYICASGCTVDGPNVEVECSHLDCEPDRYMCTGGDGSPCSGTCSCC